MRQREEETGYSNCFGASSCLSPCPESGPDSIAFAMFDSLRPNDA